MGNREGEGPYKSEQPRRPIEYFACALLQGYCLGVSSRNSQACKLSKESEAYPKQRIGVQSRIPPSIRAHNRRSGSQLLYSRARAHLITGVICISAAHNRRRSRGMFGIW